MAGSAAGGDTMFCMRLFFAIFLLPLIGAWLQLIVATVLFIPSALLGWTNDEQFSNRLDRLVWFPIKHVEGFQSEVARFCVCYLWFALVGWLGGTIYFWINEGGEAARSWFWG